MSPRPALAPLVNFRRALELAERGLDRARLARTKGMVGGDAAADSREAAAELREAADVLDPPGAQGRL